MADLRARVAAVMEAHWRPDGYTVPNAAVYPWQWLWDSCFHALVWAELDRPDRAVAELAAALSAQGELGWVPHIRYVDRPDHLADFWGRPATSSITQPPMFGHAIAELRRRQVVVPAGVVNSAVAAVRFLLDHRQRSADGLVTVVHPWETGCDDSPRWDDWGAADPAAWYEAKGRLLAAVVRGPDGAPVASPTFGVAPAGFNALVAWNAAELGLVDDASSLAGSLASRWDPGLGTWTDGPNPSGRVRTADALLPALVVDAAGLAGRALDQLVDPHAFGAPFGPTGVHRAEPTYEPERYWRGGSWPSLDYLLWRAARRWDHPAAEVLGRRLVTGAEASGLAEYWHPDTGAGLGAVPQSWAGLALLAAGADASGP